MELYDPFNQEWLKNKFYFYDEIRSKDKAYWSEKHEMYVYVKHDDVVFILSNPEIFISGKGNLVKDSPYRFGKTPGASDGKTHEKLRGIVKEAYSKNRINAVNESIRNKTIELLYNVNDEPIDITGVIRSVSAYMSAEIINLPGIEKNYLSDLIVGIQLHSDRTNMYNTDNKEYDEFVKIIRETVTNKIPIQGPGIYQEFMEKNVPPQWISLFTGPVISGCYSMISALEFTIFNLYKENVVEDIAKNLDLVPAAIQEALRFNATTGKFARTVNKEITIGGVDLKINDRVAVCLDAAGRDPAVFENPNKFDLNRKFGKSHPFGYGVHSCAGQAIARAGLEEFLKTFFEVFGKYKILTQEKDLEYIITSTANNDIVKEILIKKIR